jgi:hypothetical protein
MADYSVITCPQCDGTGWVDGPGLVTKPGEIKDSTAGSALNCEIKSVLCDACEGAGRTVVRVRTSRELHPTTRDWIFTAVAMIVFSAVVLWLIRHF